jgi:Dinitrogenase iron-molybdenum cofactor.
MLRIAFASTDRVHVNLHFGGAESLVIFDVEPGRADLVGVAAFQKAEQVGSDGRVGLEGTVQDKVLAKLDFVQGCAAVYAASIGASSIRRLMALGIQPVIVDDGHEILDLLNEVSLAMVYGGLPWVDRAKANAEKSAQVQRIDDDSRRLMASVDELD